jgi:CheY-like chemotaxis protein
MRASLPSSIEIRRNIDSSVPSILGDPTQIHQVLMNLCMNAWHAMGEAGGVLEVSLANVEVDVDFAKAYPGLKVGPHVHLVVSDTGEGMNRETMERIFEPFFTTKTPGSGTGLGLSVVHGIVKQLEGEIAVYSEVGKGTTFNVYWPLHDHEATPALPAVNVVPQGNGEHILFVDDEESLASLGKSMLERLGYRVTTETSSTEALKMFRAQANDFDLVITDQTMPNMGGAELAKELRGIRPDLPVILTTGYSTAINPEKAAVMGIREFLFKPNTAQSLAEAVQRALDVRGNS